MHLPLHFLSPAIWLVILHLTLGCAHRTSVPEQSKAVATHSNNGSSNEPAASRRLAVPFVKQFPDFCGEACVEMAAAYYGVLLPQRQVHRVSGLRGPRGVHADELETTLQRLGLPHEKRYWRPRISAEALGQPSQPDYAADRAHLMAAIDLGHPVLLGVWADPSDKQHAQSWDFDHFVLLIGYDRMRQVFFIHDPLGEKNREVSWEEFRQMRENRRGAFYSLVLQGPPSVISAR